MPCPGDVLLSPKSSTVLLTVRPCSWNPMETFRTSSLPEPLVVVELVSGRLRCGYRGSVRVVEATGGSGNVQRRPVLVRATGPETLVIVRARCGSAGHLGGVGWSRRAVTVIAGHKGNGQFA